MCPKSFSFAALRTTRRLAVDFVARVERLDEDMQLALEEIDRRRAPGEWVGGGGDVEEGGFSAKCVQEKLPAFDTAIKNHLHLHFLQSSSHWPPASAPLDPRMPPSPATPTSQRHGRGSTLCGSTAACRVTCKHCPGSGTARPRNITTPSCTRGVGRRWVGGGQPSLPPLLLKMQPCGGSGVALRFKVVLLGCCLQVGHYYRSDLVLLGLADDSVSAPGNGSTGSGALQLGDGGGSDGDSGSSSESDSNSSSSSDSGSIAAELYL